MRTPITLRINREGHFSVTTHAETYNQCGKVGMQKYKYFVTIEASNKFLTKEGYVMENAWCDDYFRMMYTDNADATCESCETMAQDAIKFFLAKFAAHNDLKKVDLKRIYVRIHGSEYSFIEAEWYGKE